MKTEKDNHDNEDLTEENMYMEHPCFPVAFFLPIYSNVKTVQNTYLA